MRPQQRIKSSLHLTNYIAHMCHPVLKRSKMRITEPTPEGGAVYPLTLYM